MIPTSLLHEFGFSDAEKFPQRLCQHAVSLTLPTAIEHGVEPLEVIIDDGLIIPVQTSGSGGMIILSDGTMLHVSHRDVTDPASPLESRFIKEIPYELRSSVSNIMRRAVQADSSLADLWGRISAAWKSWFPVLEGDASALPAGEFSTIAAAWHGMAEILGRWTEEPIPGCLDLSHILVKVIVQSEIEFQQGWLGEELIVDETSLRAIVKPGRVKYLMQNLFPRLQMVLRNPMFSSASVFRLYYSSRTTYVIRLVIAPLKAGVADSAGIELTLDSLDGFTPSVG